MIILSVIMRTKYVRINYSIRKKGNAHLLGPLQLVVDSLHISLHSADLVGLMGKGFGRSQRYLFRFLQELQRVFGSIDGFPLCLQNDSKDGNDTCNAC